MNRSSIVQMLEETKAFLGQEGAFLLAPRDREELAEKAKALLSKARDAGEVLYVGILGGTGVGKSTLINALAQSEISSASDRRPFTDKAVVYRHKQTERGLDDIAHLLRDPDAVHQSDTIKDLALIDLPDFDSVHQGHRRTVNEILPKLDCVVWVVSPEKYADEVFYQMVRDTAISRENLTFVLNKADELIVDEKTDRHSRFKEVLGDFTFRLKHEAGLEEPRTFVLSADQALRAAAEDPVLKDEFKRFRDFLMVRREAKEIASVKTGNLLEETRRVLNDLKEIAQADEKMALVESIRGFVGRPRANDAEPALRLVEARELLTAPLFALLTAEDSSIGPVRLLMRLMGRIRSLSSDSSCGHLEAALRTAAGVLAKETLAGLETFGAQMDSELVLALRSTDFVKSTTEPQEVFAKAMRNASTACAQEMERIRRSSHGFRGWLRRLVQKLVLVIPVLVFLVNLAGYPRVETVVAQPSAGGALGLVLACLTSLFSPDGLAGLAVLLIFELLLAWYLAARKLKRLEQAARRIAQFVIGYLNQSLKEAEQEARKDRERTAERIENAVNRLTNLDTAVERAIRGS